MQPAPLITAAALYRISQNAKLSKAERWFHDQLVPQLQHEAEKGSLAFRLSKEDVSPANHWAERKAFIEEHTDLRLQPPDRQTDDTWEGTSDDWFVSWVHGGEEAAPRDNNKRPRNSSGTQ